MKHLGDITKIHGYEAPIVDVVIGGSPCQDLSVAGKRAGLAGERSGLFMEQLRIIKEMREHDIRNGRSVQYIRPRYMVWENVPGAFSSNKGEDFRAVLEETARVADKDAVIPMPPKGKWETAGCIMGEGWSIAWRVLDAQFWGVPQRRRRIALVADFGGCTAPEILFERKGLHGDSDESGAQREGIAADAEGCAGADLYNQCLTGNVAKSLSSAATDADHVPCVVYPTVGEGVCGTLDAHYANTPGVRGGMERTVVAQEVTSYDIGEARLRNPQEYKEVSPTLTSRCGTGGNNVPAVVIKDDIRT